MIASYLRTAFRTLYRDKYYAIINIVGLAVAIACAILLGLYLNHELNYDRHNENHEKIYRVVNLLNTNGFIEDFSKTPILLGPLLERDYPQVESFLRFQDLATTIFRNEEIGFYQDSVMFADPGVFTLFTHEILAGDAETALVDPLSMAISESFAEVYFGEQNPIGQTLATDTSEYQVSLVFADLPENSHFRYDALLSMNRLDPASISDLGSQRAQNSLGNTSTYTYLELPADYQIDSFETISTDFWARYMAPIFSDTTVHEYYLEPLTDIHLHSTTLADSPRGSASFVYALSAIGVFLLLVASMNYMNLSTARSTKRAKEVAMRKLLGSERSQLIVQFLGESLFFVCLAIPLAFLLAALVIEYTPLNTLLGMTLNGSMLLQITLILSVVVASLLLATFSGLYPAFFLSSMKPTSVSGVSKESSNRLSSVRHGLVLIQFAISIGVIACTLLMYSQMEFFYNKSLGFEKENKLVVRIRDDNIVTQLAAVKDQLLSNPQVLGITSSGSLPGGGFNITSTQAENAEGELEQHVFNMYSIGEDYFEVMGMEMVEGREFDSSITTDADNALIVNETAKASLGWEESIGRRIANLPVVGVVQDFNFHELGRELEPLVLLYDPLAEQSSFVTLNLSGESVAETINFVQSTWNQFDPTHPFEYEFLDARINDLYSAEQSNMSLVGIFASLCVLISCLGLAGLTAFTTEQRSKEIGIRKILGATSIQLILMLFRNVFVVVITAAFIASLVSFLVMNRWLQGFAYHIEINSLTFFAATLFCVAVAFVTMAAQTWKTSRSNPVDALRYE
ncbi:MAG: FtsX-like permease family protein [Pseudomonadales bacterium]|nr:FtsX-like permease family protein [Pseudomonadales bacterium]